MSTPTRYPIYVPSKGRWMNGSTTMHVLERNGTPYRLVVERTERDQYAARFHPEQLLVLPFVDRGVSAARNWLMDHSIAEGHARHWQLDDNVREFFRRWRGGKRLAVDPAVALRVTEDFADRYENVAVAGLNYFTFAQEMKRQPVYLVNHRVYSCCLVLNSLPNRWRVRLNEDTDYCLQVLSTGWCTVLLNAFLIEKKATMRLRGGNTPNYQGDGRLEMARSLERLWPGVVETHRKWGRPQHHVNWRRFTTPLRLRPDVDLSRLPPVDDYGMRLVQVADEVRSPRIRALLEDAADS